MQPVARTTFIHPDGDAETPVSGGVAFDTDGMKGVRVLAEKAPSWVGVGSEVVAASEDGKVIVAFTVDVMEEEPGLWADEDVKCTVLRSHT